MFGLLLAFALDLRWASELGCLWAAAFGVLLAFVLGLLWAYELGCLWAPVSGALSVCLLRFWYDLGLRKAYFEQ